MKPFAAALCVVGVLCARGAQAAAPEVTIEPGTVRGSVSGTTVVFKGIPYAAAPVGELRWRAPQRVQPWPGVRDATAFGPECVQNAFPQDPFPRAAGSPVPAEDCLYLNVWAPAGAAARRLPVLVWIHGGAYVVSSGSRGYIDGTAWSRQGVILVSFNYRMGRFGFFAHPALTHEAGDGLTGNFACMDWIAALRWVRANIAAFGGDPGQVTIGGESAGGDAVLHLIATPEAQGLFQRAIVMSGGGRPAAPLPLTSTDSQLRSGESAGLAFARSQGIEGADDGALHALRALPAGAVLGNLGVTNTGSDPTYAGGPIRDGRLIGTLPDAAIEDGSATRVALLIGADSAEFLEMNPDRSAAAALGDKAMVEPARHIARLAAARGWPTFAYRFDYVPTAKRGEWPGMPHAREQPFVFGSAADQMGFAASAGDRRMARIASRYWAGFVKMGIPSAEGAPAWPRYDAKGDRLMVFTPNGPRAMRDPWRDRLDAVERVATGR